MYVKEIVRRMSLVNWLIILSEVWKCMGFNCVVIRFPKAKLADLLFSLPFSYVSQIHSMAFHNVFQSTSYRFIIFVPGCHRFTKIMYYLCFPALYVSKNKVCRYIVFLPFFYIKFPKTKFADTCVYRFSSVFFYIKLPKTKFTDI